MATALIGVPPVNASAAAHKRMAASIPLPNLTVSRGAVSLSHGRVVGSFTVRNSGREEAGRSRAQLSVTVGKRHRSLGVFRVPALEPHSQIKIKVSVVAPSGLSNGGHHVLACADSAKAIRESSEHDNCTAVGTLTIPAASSVTPAGSPTTAPPASTPPAPTPTPTPTPTATGAAATPTQPQPGTAQKPTAPMMIGSDTPTLVHDAYDGMTGSYYVNTPPRYDTAGATPMRLLVWMHGCGGEAEGDSYEISTSNSGGGMSDDDNRDFVSISIGGRDDACWNPDTDVQQVLMAIADVTTRFNIDRRHIFIAGYSSGGDLAYRTIFYNADEFAGILTVNTHPFRDTGSTEAQSLAAAAWKFNIAHVAHAQDDEYHVSACAKCINDDTADDPGVTPAMNDLKTAGYSVNYVIEPGDHYDDDDFKAGTGTDYDWRKYVLPFIDNASWISPA